MVAVLFRCTIAKSIPLLYLKNSPIKCSNHVKYLEMTIGQSLSFTKHNQNAILKETGAKGILYRVLNRKKPTPIRTRLNVLKLYITPILTYTKILWVPYVSSYKWKSLDAVLKISINTVTRMPTFVSNDTIRKSTGFKSIQDSIKGQTFNSFLKNSFSQFLHIRNIGK